MWAYDEVMLVYLHGRELDSLASVGFFEGFYFLGFVLLPPPLLQGLLEVVRQVLLQPGHGVGRQRDLVAGAPSVVQLGLVAVLPDVGQDDGGVEAEEDAERQQQAVDHGPRAEAVEVALHRAVLDLLHLEGVHEPERDVDDEQEGDHLPARLVVVLPLGADSPSLRVSNEQQLKQHLRANRNEDET